MKTKYTNEEYKKYLLKKKSDFGKKKITTEMYARDLRINKTKQEDVLRSYINMLGIRCEFQKVFYTKDNKKIPMIVDFYLPSRKIVIESDGNQHLYNSKQVYKDKCRDEYFANLGIRTIRILNSEIDTLSIQKFKALLK